MKSLYLLDFDETLFNAETLKEDLQTFFMEKYDLDFSNNYENSKNEHGAYDFFLHLENEGIKKSREEMKIDFEDFFSKNKYEYDEILKFLEKILIEDNTVYILTLGYEDFQELKQNITNNIKNIERISMLTDKAEFLEDNLEKIGEGIKFRATGEVFDQVFFVDDKPKSFMKNPPEGFKQYRIRRKGAKYYDAESPEYTTEINLLTEIN